jgi:DNA-binding NarL/FixJ family response regulator
MERAARRGRLEGTAILLAGRHELYVASLGALLASLGAEVHLAGDPARLPEAVPQRTLDFVLLESPRPAEVAELAGGPPVIVLAERPGPDQVFEAVQAGAASVLDKNASIAELSLTLRGALDDADLPAGATTITGRQREVLTLVAKGLDNGEIAARLGISRRTVREHVSELLERLGVANRTQAAVVAVRRGWIHHEEPSPKALPAARRPN